MTETRARQHYSTHTIQKTLQISPQSPDELSQLQTQIPFEVEVDEDMFEMHIKMIEERNKEVQKIEQDTLLVRDMFKDLAGLIEEQQPTIGRIHDTLNNEAKVNVEAGNFAIEEADSKKSGCVIL